MYPELLDSSPAGFRYGFIKLDTFIGIKIVGTDIKYEQNGDKLVPVSGKVTSIEYSYIDDGPDGQVLKTVTISDLVVDDIAQLNIASPNWFKLNEYNGVDDFLAGGNTNLSSENDVFFGSDISETIRGNEGNDLIGGEGGNDILRGGAGIDRLFGGNGNDQLYGDSGDDSLAGEGGDDFLFGGAGNDVMGGDTRGGEIGNDTLLGGDGDDQLISFGGQDILLGQGGDDQISSFAGNNFLHGGSGDDIISSANGNSILMGGTGNDTLYSASGNNILIGGAGEDVFLFLENGEAGAGNSIITDFNLEDDMLKLILNTGTTAQEQFDLFQQNAVQIGNSVLLTSQDGASTTTIQNLDLADLTVDHFVES